MKTIDVMPGDTWTTGGGLIQYRNGESRFVWIDKISAWGHANRVRLEIDCAPEKATAILAAYGYTINHAQPEAKPVRVTHGVMPDYAPGLIVWAGTLEACERRAADHSTCTYTVVPLAFGPESA